MSKILEELDKRIDEYIEKEDFSGVIRVTIKDKIVYEKRAGYADYENKIPHTADTEYTFYSLSKPFCTLGVMKLVDKGLVSLDDHPKKYVPEMEGFDERVTIRQMLQHTSGLPDYAQTPGFYDKYAKSGITDHRKLTEIITGYPMFFEPGKEARYCTSNFTFCALIIENVSKMPYAEYMRQEVFLPLGMTTAYIDYDGKFIPNRACGYTKQDGKIVRTQKEHFIMLGGGDVVGRVDDVYKLNEAIKHKKLISERSWQEIFTRSSVSYHTMGLGCNMTVWHGKNRITHNGGHVGFRTLHVQLVDDDFDLILLSNSEWGNARETISEIVHECFYGNDNSLSQVVEMDKGYV